VANTDRPLVSVIVPTYNRAHCIKTAITSIIEQSYTNWELLIIDDGSTDQTKSIISTYTDSRIRYSYQKNAGPKVARNYGLQQSQGAWITYLDSDDILYPNCIQTMVSALSKHPNVVFAMPDGLRILDLYKNGKIVKTTPDPEELGTTFTVRDIYMRNARFACLGFMHLRRLFDEGLMWDENVAGMEDWEFMLTIGAKYPDQFLFVPAQLYEYHQRFGGDGLCANSTYSTWANAFEYIYEKHKHDPLMQGQEWYPAKVKKWRKRQTEFEAGIRPAYALHYFQA
jgi:glycosyltransferase involved in cell wall biosynthesis